MLPEDPVPAPSLAWRTASTATIVATGLFAKTFLKTCAYTETRGLDRFLKLLEERRDVAKRKRGLITGKYVQVARLVLRLTCSGCKQFPIISACMNPHKSCDQPHFIRIDKCVSIDDPLIWGFLPLRYFFSPNNIRWSLGSHDICFKDGFVTC
jgi:monolysocardiolipin acyltransferase